jgi:hypothetical protein
VLSVWIAIGLKVRVTDAKEGLGVSCHVLNHTWLAAFYVRNSVSIVFGAGVNVHGLINSGRKVGLGCLLGKVRARDFNL